MTTPDRYALFLAEQLCRLGVHFAFVRPDRILIVDRDQRISPALRSELQTHREALHALLAPSPRALAKAMRAATTPQATPMPDFSAEQPSAGAADAPITSDELRRFTSALAAKLEAHTTPERARQLAAENADRAGRNAQGQVEAMSAGGVPYAAGSGKDAMTLLAGELLSIEQGALVRFRGERDAEQATRTARNPLAAPPQPYKNPLL